MMQFVFGNNALLLFTGLYDICVILVFTISVLYLKFIFTPNPTSAKVVLQNFYMIAVVARSYQSFHIDYEIQLLQSSKDTKLNLRMPPASYKV